VSDIEEKHGLRTARDVRKECFRELIKHVERMADYESERGIGDDETQGYCRACDQMLVILRKKLA